MFRVSVISTFLAGLLLGCNSGEEAIKKAESDVFAIHDEVMPKMDDLMKLKKQLNQQITTLDSLKASGLVTATVRTDEEREQAVRLVRNLTLADSLMMDWMAQYNGDTLTKLSHEEALRYLGAQKDQIEDVKTKYDSSLEQARQFLGKK